MSIQAILLPLFVEVTLTLCLLLWLAELRRRDFKSGTVRPSQIALREPNWPARTQQVAYSFSNQFELPVLFYVLTILEIITRHADLIFVVLAWIFVLMRCAAARSTSSARSCSSLCGSSSWSASCWACHDAGRAARRRYRSFRKS